ncbi:MULTISPECIES: hypothetical protein [Enterobacterales]|uniref:Uncharacterized protein n=6 Tax=Enterobacterales TaxID=91347 RepID=A0A7L8KA86_ECOLX|nr:MULTISPECIES: hypothetical protein [Enterobacterales]ELB1214872.1 hypothetical protein [Proteus mirabilis]ELY4881514.1 hypothetical protein [Morganella morganii]SPY66545.1 Uncharacterised protein [Providencia stuartii]ELR5094313.1 hypothetical protein [Providencia rettgeri]ELR5243162.1 hypothetical protein [Providencia rettgeri]
MTEKRGTGTEYGQDKLKERAEASEVTEEKKPKSKLKIISIVVIAAIGVGALYPVVFDSKKTPAEKNEEVVALNSDGTAIGPVVTNADDKESLSDSNKSVTTDTAIADKPAASEHSDADKPADPENSDADKAATDKADAGNAEQPVDHTDPEQMLMDMAAPTNPSVEIVPAEKIVSDAHKGSPVPQPIAQNVSDGSAGISDKLAPEDVQGIKNAVNHDPTVNNANQPANEANAAEANAAPKFRTFEPSKFGIDNVAAPQHVIAQPSAQPATLPQYAATNNAPSDSQNSDDVIKNYTGQSEEVTYQVQSQNTVYVYGSFAAKVYLLPVGKNEKVNAYLSDSKGWQISQLPGDILRIQRSANKSDWSDATDLFLVAGKRTYTLILQAVDQPKLRTDSLRYMEPKTQPAHTGKK